MRLITWNVRLHSPGAVKGDTTTSRAGLLPPNLSPRGRAWNPVRAPARRSHAERRCLSSVRDVSACWRCLTAMQVMALAMAETRVRRACCQAVMHACGTDAAEFWKPDDAFSIFCATSA